MLKKVVLAIGAALRVAGGIVAAKGLGGKAKEEAKVICCGECKRGDTCLEKCTIVGEVPKGAVLTCCGSCEKGQNCLEKCAKASCWEGN
jgi:hypothetical protein